jgi:chitin-binding protein
MTPGAALTMRYVSTIPHTGTFRLYLTKPGYDPTKPLTWSDLPEKPFAEVTDPALTNGAYRINAALPSDRTGRHVLYTIWQNSSTPDTYYSCSDVVFPAAKSGGAGTRGAGPATGGGTGGGTGEGNTGTPPDQNGRTGQPGQRATPAKESPAPTGSAPDAVPSGSPAEAGAAPESTPVASAADTDSSPSAPTMAGGAAAVLLLTGGAALALRMRRR